MHPHLAQNLTAERIRGWQEEAAQARLAREARRARRGRRSWVVWRSRVPATTGLASPSSGSTAPAPPVMAQRGAGGGRPARAAERVPAAADGHQRSTADEYRAVAADEHQLATTGEHQPLTAEVERTTAADERQPAGPRAA